MFRVCDFHRNSVNSVKVVRVMEFGLMQARYNHDRVILSYFSYYCGLLLGLYSNAIVLTA